jgi:putative transcriptional regulator
MSRKTDAAKDFDWTAFDALTDEEVHAAALADPDAQPWTEERLAKAKVTPRIKIVRRALRLTQEEFSEQFGIPLGTLRDWEQGRKEPDQTARAYLKAIANDPEAVRRAYLKKPGRAA